MSNLMVPDSEEFIPTRKSLLHRLKDWNDQSSWRNFFDTYWKLIYGVARKSGLSTTEAEDVVQETILTVAKQMRDFTYDPAVGSFKGWLMQITRRRIADLIRKKQYQSGSVRLPREEALGTTLLNNRPDTAPFNVEENWDEEWEKNLFQVALKKVKLNVDALQYQMFYLHIIKEVPVLEVMQRLGVKKAEVYFAKYKLSALIKKEIALLEKNPAPAIAPA